MKKHWILLAVLLVCAAACLGISTYRFVLQIQSGGSTIATYTSFAKLNCAVGQCTASGSTVTMNAGRMSCDIVIGDTSASALTNGQLGPQVGLCYVPYGATVLEIDVRADGGTPNVIVAKSHAGAVSNLVSGALATASSGGIACSKTTNTVGLDGVTTCSATLQNTPLLTGDYIEFVSGTAGGVAKEMNIHVIYQ